MNLLFLHPNMPGQFKHLAQAFGAEGGHRIYFITKHKTAEIPGVTRVTYQVKQAEHTSTHRYLRLTERATFQGQAAWRAARHLKDTQGFVPDLVISHPGWGDTLFLRDLFPSARFLDFCEFYYRGEGADVDFDPEDPMGDDDHARMRMKNVTNLLNLTNMDWGLTPTTWQWSLHPPEYRERISVMHDGIDTNLCRPNPQASFTTTDGHTFRPGDEVVTYIARNFEPYRGFPTFCQAAELLLKERPNCHIIAVGADGVSYGKIPGKDTTYRQIWSQKVNLPAERMHWMPTVPYDQLLQLFQISAAHIYLTYPFVLSWSLLEAMSCGVALVASRTAPVMEAVEDGVHGRLVDFFSPRALADALHATLDAPDKNAAMRAAARARVVERYELSKLLPLHMQLVRELAAGQVPPPVHAQMRQINPIIPAAMWQGKK